MDANNNNTANATPGVEKELRFGMALNQVEYNVEMYNKLTSTCFAKCVENRYKEGELNLGETSCIDRCFSKYIQVTDLVGQLLGISKPPM